MLNMASENADFITKNAILIFFFILFMIVIVYISDKVGKREVNCRKIRDVRFEGKNNDIVEFYSLQDSIRNGYFKGNITINDTPIEYDYKLKDFYIKTAHNCFCSGKFSNDYVDRCALQNCASYGVRALDMQIFSIDDIPVIAANSVNTNLYKETYNSIPLKDALNDIDETFTQSNFYDDSVQNTMKDDPLFLIFRIHYDTNVDYKKNPSSTRMKKQTEFYDKIYNTILNQFNLSRLASSDLRSTYSEQYFNDRSGFIGNFEMKELSDKIFIFVILNDDDQNYEALRKSKLDRIVDLYGNEMNHFHFNDLFISDAAYKINKHIASNEMSLCLPTRSAASHNMDFIQAMKKGTQFIAMNFQNNDALLQQYNQFFISQYGGGDNVASSPYIKKPDHMIQLPLTLS
tara:strand:+ start:3578 stop:4786 length:1209 start_codon:yes stop_codon:yes gene_type:complete